MPAPRTALASVVSQSDLRLMLVGHEQPVQSASFSPDGAKVVTASFDGTTRLWDAVSGKDVAVLRDPGGTVSSAAFSPDGLRIVTASGDKTARVWDLASGQEIAVLRGHEKDVVSAAFSPDGSRVVTASADGTTRIWDAMMGKEIAVLRGHGDPKNSAAFSPDGKRIVTASEDTTARIWDAHFATASTKELLAEVCTRGLHGLTWFSREEMRLAGYPDSSPVIDVCAGIE